MDDALLTLLRHEDRFALAYARPVHRAVFAAAFALDARLQTIVAGAREPALAQIKLAWWREQLGNGHTGTDPVLAALSTSWTGGGEGLNGLIDGWEEFLLAERGEADGLAEGHAELAGALALQLGEENVAAASCAGGIWGRGLAQSMGIDSRPAAQAHRLPPALRPLAILSGLAQRSLRRGNGDLLGDRISPLVAMRLGIFGR